MQDSKFFRKYARSNLEANGLAVSAEIRMKIPRNESINLFLRDKFNELNSVLIFQPFINYLFLFY